MREAKRARARPTAISRTIELASLSSRLKGNSRRCPSRGRQSRTKSCAPVASWVLGIFLLPSNFSRARSRFVWPRREEAAESNYSSTSGRLLGAFSWGIYATRDESVGYTQWWLYPAHGYSRSIMASGLRATLGRREWYTCSASGCRDNIYKEFRRVFQSFRFFYQSSPEDSCRQASVCQAGPTGLWVHFAPDA